MPIALWLAFMAIAGSTGMAVSLLSVPGIGDDYLAWEMRVFRDRGSWTDAAGAALQCAAATIGYSATGMIRAAAFATGVAALLLLGVAQKAVAWLQTWARPSAPQPRILFDPRSERALMARLEVL